ncbi:MAG: acetate--CoA ligase family protein [Nitrospinae bacterium]|nr:acetate--CoA ligase family protein [Nitrospinota bacterium]
MTAHESLKSLFHPESFAVVGAASDLNRLGGIPLRLTMRYGFPGPIYPINPRREEIAGLKCYPDVDSLPEAPEFALICTPREDVLPALVQCAERGVKAAAVITSGFAETGPEGAALQEKILALRDESGMRVLGPNCMGVVHVRSKLMATFTISIRDDDPLIPGAVAIVTQSGAMGACMLTGFQESGSGISSLVSLGNEVDVDFAECVEYFIDDPHTRVICGYLESVRDGERLKRAALRALAREKPIVLLKGGKTEEGARAARSHTAALTTESDVFDAFAAQYGVQVPDSMDEFIEVADFLARSKPIQGNGVGVLSFSGGLGSLAADLCTEAGLALPILAEGTQAKLAGVLPDYAPKDNPVDLVSLMVSKPESQPLKTAGEAVAGDESVDALLFMMGVYHHVGEQIAAEVKALFESSPVPVAFAWLTGPREQIQALRKASVPVFGDYARAIRGLESLLSLKNAREAAASRTRSIDHVRAEKAKGIIREAPSSPDGFLPPEACAKVLDLYKIPRPREALVNTAEEALKAWEEFQAPVALKVVSELLSHKTEAGGVILGLNTPDEVLSAAQKLLALADDARLLVQEMIEDGLELLVGISNDPTFGPCVTAGLGGVYVETLDDVARLLPPFEAGEAARALSGLRSRVIFDGFRSGPAVQIPHISDIMVKISELATELEDTVAEMDINPLIATAEGCLAADVRIKINSR